MKTICPSNLDECTALDREDPLADRRELFDLPHNVLYLDGHSLGPASHVALARLGAAAGSEWADGLIRSWNSAGWIDLTRRIGGRLSRLLRAQPEEVIVADSVSTNIFKLAAAALGIATSQTLIVEEDDFPTDQYIAEGLAGLSGINFIRAKAGEGIAHLGQTGGVLIKSLVHYRTAAIADIAAAERVAAESGGFIVWDLSHATGVLDLDMSQAKLAVGCTYKYLNGGPGAPAFLYVRQDVSSALATPLPGWMGHARPFDFSPSYEPAAGVQRFANGTPPILSLSALAGALDAFDGIQPHQLEAKARGLGDLCLARAKEMGLRSSSPGRGERRGGHVTLHHEEGYAIIQALIARGIIGDFRAPDAMRFGFSPLYTSYCDVWEAMDALEDVLGTRAWDHPEFKTKAMVT